MKTDSNFTCFNNLLAWLQQPLNVTKTISQEFSTKKKKKNFRLQDLNEWQEKPENLKNRNLKQVKNSKKKKKTNSLLARKQQFNGQPLKHHVVWPKQQQKNNVKNTKRFTPTATATATTTTSIQLFAFILRAKREKNRNNNNNTNEKSFQIFKEYFENFFIYFQLVQLHSLLKCSRSASPKQYEKFIFKTMK